jgi:phage gpG-like protein
MAKSSAVLDFDMGLENIKKQIEQLGKMSVKCGITEDKGDAVPKGGDATVAEYGTWNEFGVKRNGKQHIPSRPFIRGWADGKKKETQAVIERLAKQVSSGKMLAASAINKLGVYGASGIKSYIRTGNFTPNADSTKARKGSSKPLIDTGTLRNSIGFEAAET